MDVAVLEVGMGGRLDATNVVQHPITTGITLIDLEHTQILGNTFQQIAYEKAGIFKHNSPAVVLQQRSEVMQVFQQCAEIEGIFLSFTQSQDVHCKSFLPPVVPPSYPIICFRILLLRLSWLQMFWPILGIPKNGTIL